MPSDTNSDDDLKDGVAKLDAAIAFLNAAYISDGCDGSVYGCISCDAVRLRTDLIRLRDETRDLDEIDFKTIEEKRARWNRRHRQAPGTKRENPHA